MITQERLDELEQHANSPTRDMISFSHAETRELVRLARLGLWAEKHGVPALEEVEATCGACSTADALAALPTEKESP